MSQTQNKPAIVLVHGAWHLPAHYSSFIARLRSAGFSVICPALPTCTDATRSSASMYTDAAAIRAAVQPLIDDEAQDVIMLLHSYGGVVGSEAVKGLSKRERAANGLAGGVVHLVYMCAFMLQEGESVGAVSLPRPEPEHVEVDPETGTSFVCEDPVRLFYGDVEEGVAREMVGLLVRHSARAFADELTYAAWKDVPTTYLRTEEDEILFPAWQQRQIDAVGSKGVSIRIESYKSSHSPFLSMPEEMIKAVERVVEL